MSYTLNHDLGYEMWLIVQRESELVEYIYGRNFISHGQYEAINEEFLYINDKKECIFRSMKRRMEITKRNVC